MEQGCSSGRHSLFFGGGRGGEDGGGEGRMQKARRGVWPSSHRPDTHARMHALNTGAPGGRGESWSTGLQTFPSAPSTPYPPPSHLMRLYAQVHLVDARARACGLDFPLGMIFHPSCLVRLPLHRLLSNPRAQVHLVDVETRELVYALVVTAEAQGPLVTRWVSSGSPSHHHVVTLPPFIVYCIGPERIGKTMAEIRIED